MEFAPRSDSTTDELYLLPRMNLLGSLLGELDSALWRAVEDSSRSLATRAVQFALASLWSRIPDFPVEEAMGGIDQRFEEEAQARTEVVAREVVNTFAPMPASDPPAGGDAYPEA